MREEGGAVSAPRGGRPAIATLLRTTIVTTTVAVIATTAVVATLLWTAAIAATAATIAALWTLAARAGRTALQASTEAFRTEATLATAATSIAVE